MMRWIAAYAVLLAALACDQATDLKRLQAPPQLSDLASEPGPWSPIEVLDGWEATLYCHTVTFENSPHYLPINPEHGGLVPAGNIAFSSNWRTLTRGAYANNPSGVAIAVWLQNGSPEVSFPSPVASVGLYYSSYVPVQIRAFDAAGELVATVEGARNVDRGFVNWSPLAVEVFGNRITRAVVDGVANRTAIDDLKNCTRVITRETCKDGGWEEFGFRNQGQCIRFVETGKDSR